MKKKIRNFFETCMILAVVLAFVIPGASSITKPTLSKETLGISDAEIEWVPVDASGSHTIIGHKIFLHETEKLVTLEIHVSGWDPHLLKAVQATVDSAGYSNGVGDTLNPLGWPGSPEDGCFIDNSRPDYVFHGMTAIDAVYTGDLDYMWGATLLFGGKVDDGQTYYLGTLILEVPTNADGTYTIGFLADVTKTFMTDDDGQNILPLILTPALITINQLPSAPTIAGRTNGKIGVEYEYTFIAVDPDGDNVKYHIDWDDGNFEETGFNPSGTDVKVKHTWNNEGTYTIRAAAEDTYGLVGPEATLTVGIEPLDEYTEIISFIKGRVFGYNRIGFFGVDIYSGDVDIFALTTTGFIIGKATQVEAKFFIGLFTNGGFGYNRVNGVAFGNINW